jgi:hypothetical protein
MSMKDGVFCCGNALLSMIWWIMFGEREAPARRAVIKKKPCFAA